MIMYTYSKANHVNLVRYIFYSKNKIFRTEITKNVPGCNKNFICKHDYIQMDFRHVNTYDKNIPFSVVLSNIL